jgi:hypothetical protein
MTKPESYTSTGSDGTTFAGPDAVSLFRAAALISGLRLYAKTGTKPNDWAWSPKMMLDAATGITGKPYKRGQYEKAAADIQLWIDAMAATLPKINE